MEGRGWSTPRRGDKRRTNSPLLVLTELNRFPENLDALFPPLLSLKDEHRAHYAPHESSLLSLLQPLLSQLREQLLQLSDRLLALA